MFLRNWNVELIAPGIEAPIGPPCGFFPLRLRGEAFPRPGAVGFGVFLAHLYHRMLLQPCNATTWPQRGTPGGPVDRE